MTTNFHSLTLTFVTREVDELRRLGYQVSLLSLRRRGSGGATDPECDLSDCLYLHPVSRKSLLRSLLTTMVTRPGRLARALGVALTSRGDAWRTRLKLVGQLVAATVMISDVERLRVTHIHAHLASPPGSYALFLSILTGIPFSFTGHAADLYRQPEALPAKLMHCCGSVCISEYNRRFLERVLPGVKNSPIVHCGIRLGDFPFRERRLLEPPLRILAVGRAAEKKGFKYLLDALAVLDERKMLWRGHLVGDGPLLSELREQRASLGLDSLSITGSLQQSEIRKLLADADVFVLPCVEAIDGDIDGIPVALMEAMASGCPVVSTRLSGIPELIDNGRTGLLVEPEDAVGLADALEMIATDRALAARLSVQGRTHVEQCFNLELETRKLADFFRSCHV